jgi:hypothetical protein
LKWPGSVKNLLRVILSLGTLAFLLRTVGWREVWAVVADADIGLLAIAWLAFLLGIFIRALRWRALLHGLGLCLPFKQLISLYLVGGFFNTFLPSGFGGDVIRVLEITHDTRDIAAAGTVLLDRLTGILSLMALGVLMLPFVPDLPSWLVWTLAGVSGAGLLAGFLVLEGRWLRKISAYLPGPFSLVGQGKLAQIYAAVTGCGRRAIIQALVFSTVFNVINIGIYWLCGRAVGIPIGLRFYFIATPLLSLSLLLPISVGGLGVRDWVAKALFDAVGVLEQQSVAMSLSVYAVTALAGLVGGALYLAQAVRGFLQERIDV